ncbi:hypothetical protein JNJ66_06060 [Candidatus Saccharibacteria bacterium]|nr:hypothetical protein [Candidatus Saccharibacteria bacterium]
MFLYRKADDMVLLWIMRDILRELGDPRDPRAHLYHWLRGRRRPERFGMDRRLG